MMGLDLHPGTIPSLKFAVFGALIGIGLAVVNGTHPHEGAMLGLVIGAGIGIFAYLGGRE